MDYRNKLKNDMDEILRGDTDSVARKHIGVVADSLSKKEKEERLAKVYAELQRGYDEAEETKSELDLRKEQIENEMKNIRNKHTDALLKERIKNYDPSISREDKDKLLGEVYDRLQKERDRLDRMPDIVEPDNPDMRITGGKRIEDILKRKPVGFN